MSPKPTRTRDVKALRSQLDADVESYLTLGDKIAGLTKAQKQIRNQNILPAVEKLGLAVGEFFEGTVNTSITHPLVKMWREFKRLLIAEDIGIDESLSIVTELDETISELEPYEDGIERGWSLTKFPGSKRLNTSEFKRHLIEAGVAPKIIKAAEAKATKPGQPTIKIQWRASKDETDSYESNEDS